MKGLVGFIVVFIFVALLLELNAVGGALRARTDETVSGILSAERAYYDGLDVKNAFSQALRAGKGTRREAVERAGAALMALEAHAEESLGGSAELWFGYVARADVERMRDESVRAKRALKCGKCFDFSSLSPDWNERVVPRAIAVLDYDGKVRVSRNGLAFLPDAESVLNAFAGEPVLGATVYYADGTAGVYTVGGGFPP